MSQAINLEDWVVSAIRANGGEASIIQVAQHIWKNHERELRSSNDLFFTWQYRMRWAAQKLQKAGKLKKLKSGIYARWVLT